MVREFGFRSSAFGFFLVPLLKALDQQFCTCELDGNISFLQGHKFLVPLQKLKRLRTAQIKQQADSNKETLRGPNTRQLPEKE